MSRSYSMPNLNVFSKLVTMFASNVSCFTIVLEFKQDCIVFKSMLSDSAIGLFAYMKDPTLKSLHRGHEIKDAQLVFMGKEIKKGITISKNSCADATEFILKVADDGLELQSKRNGVIVNTTTIKAIDEELPDLTALDNDFPNKETNEPQDWNILPISINKLCEGLSGIQEKRDEVLLTIEPNKRNPTQGELALECAFEFINFKHIFVLPRKTAMKIATQKYKTTFQGVAISTLKKIIEHFNSTKNSGNKKRKHNNDDTEVNKEEEEEEKECHLRLLGSGDLLSVLYNSGRGILVRVYIMSLEDQDTTA